MRLMKMCKRCKMPTPNRDGYCDRCRDHMRSSAEARRTVTAGTPYDTAPVRSPGTGKPASSRGYGHEWHVFAREFLRRNPVCARCGRPARVCDHRDIPAQVMIDMYGRFILDPSLYQPLCVRCNTLKAAEDRARGNSAFRGALDGQAKKEKRELP